MNEEFTFWSELMTSLRSSIMHSKMHKEPVAWDQDQGDVITYFLACEEAGSCTLHQLQAPEWQLVNSCIDGITVIKAQECVKLPVQSLFREDQPLSKIRSARFLGYSIDNTWQMFSTQIHLHSWALPKNKWPTLLDSNTAKLHQIKHQGLLWPAVSCLR